MHYILADWCHTSLRSDGSVNPPTHRHTQTHTLPAQTAIETALLLGHVELVRLESLLVWTDRILLPLHPWTVCQYGSAHFCDLWPHWCWHQNKLIVLVRSLILRFIYVSSHCDSRLVQVVSGVRWQTLLGFNAAAVLKLRLSLWHVSKTAASSSLCSFNVFKRWGISFRHLASLRRSLGYERKWRH